MWYRITQIRFHWVPWTRVARDLLSISRHAVLCLEAHSFDIQLIKHGLQLSPTNVFHFWPARFLKAIHICIGIITDNTSNVPFISKVFCLDYWHYPVCELIPIIVLYDFIILFSHSFNSSIAIKMEKLTRKSLWKLYTR